MIVMDVDHSTMPTLLRVSKQFFEIAAPKVYETIEIDGVYDVPRLVMGAGIVPKLIMLRKGRFNGEEDQFVQTPNTNFKQHLLKHVKRITIRPHACPTHPIARAAVIQAAKMMTGLQRVILSPDLNDSEIIPLCQHTTCPLVSGIDCESVTVANLYLARSDPSLSDTFIAAIKQARHVTLIVPPTAMFMGDQTHFDDEVSDVINLVDATRHCETIRIVVAIIDIEMVIPDVEEYDEATITLDETQDYLSSYITFENTKIELYIFFDYVGNLDLVEFRDEFDQVVKKRYESCIKSLTEADQLKPEHLEWSPTFSMLSMENYFAVPGLSDEMDSLWLLTWEAELDERRLATAAKLKNAGDEDESAKLEGVRVSVILPYDILADKQGLADTRSSNEGDAIPHGDHIWAVPAEQGVGDEEDEDR